MSEYDYIVFAAMFSFVNAYIITNLVEIRFYSRSTNFITLQPLQLVLV